MRSTTTLMKNWQFTGPDGKTVTVDLPHTWNNIDGQDGGNDYWRGSCTYKTSFAAPAFDPAAQQVWLQFEGVGDSAKVSLNGTEIANHDGGFSTFRVDITALLKEQNELTVIADNSKNDFVYPQKADFTFYGGIYRTVSLLAVPARITSRWITSAAPVCRSPRPCRAPTLTSALRPGSAVKARSPSPSSTPRAGKCWLAKAATPP